MALRSERPPRHPLLPVDQQALRHLLSIAVFVGLSACNALPRDPEGTTDRVQEAKVLNVGLAPMNADDRSIALKLVRIVERQTGGVSRVQPIATEPGFAALDRGEIDLIVGRFEKDSPWKADVAFGPPLAKSGTGDHPIELKAAMRNGENRWIMLVENASRHAAPGVASR